jgi:hypothetical protein
MTDDISNSDVATQAPAAPAPKATRSTVAAATKGSRSAAPSKKAVAPRKSSTRIRPARGTKKSADKASTADDTVHPVIEAEAQDQDPDPDNSSGEYSSELDEDQPSEEDSGAEEEEEEEDDDDPTYQQVRSVPDPFAQEWYRQRPRIYTEETFHVSASHRMQYPRPFFIRDADFNRALASCSIGAKQDSDVLYTLASFGTLRLNQTHEFMESHPKLQGSVRRHLEEGWLYQLGLYEYTLARLDIIEGLEGDAQAQALARIQ